MANKKQMDFIYNQVEFELTPLQRFQLFKDLYLTFSIDDMVKYEKVMLKQILASTDCIEDKFVEGVEKACKTILKSYKRFKK